MYDHIHRQIAHSRIADLQRPKPRLRAMFHKPEKPPSRRRPKHPAG